MLFKQVFKHVITILHSYILVKTFMYRVEYKNFSSILFLKNSFLT